MRSKAFYFHLNHDCTYAEDYHFSQAISIYVHCENEEEIDGLFKKLSEEGGAMMPLGDYGLSKKFGWLADRHGVSWQLNLPS
jgi:predicted 3-demethylubiquinone-9 3-methyltransferase (glyoxalase superfamily)